MTLALDGVRVLDFGHYLAGPLCGLLLAEQGADVVHVVPPSGERWEHPANAYLHRHKRTIPLDLHATEGRRRAVDLAARADVVLDNFRPGVLARLGVMVEEELGDRVWLSLPGFASSDHRAGERAWEGILGAATGLFTDVHVTREVLGLPPVFTALPLASSYGAVHGALAVVAALHRRARRGVGTRVEVPLSDALFAAMGSMVLRIPNQPPRYDIPPVPRFVRDGVLPAVRWLLRHVEAGRRPLLERTRGLMPPLMDSYPCADGRLLYVFAMDHETMVSRLARVLGIRQELEGLGFVLASASTASAIGRDLRDAARLPRRRRVQLRDVLARALRARPAVEWETALNEAGVPAAMQRSAHEWMEWAPVVEAGLVTRWHDPDLGPVQAPGASVLVGAPRPVVGRSAHAAEEVARDWTTRRSAEPVAASPVARPFEGLRVVDLSSMVAGPIGARTLGEYGAEVWKIDPPHPHHGPRMTRWYGIEVNQGKRFATLDLQDPAQRQALASLLETTDLLVHNLRPEARTRLGLDEASLRSHPRLLVTSVSAYRGPAPSSIEHWPGYDPVLQAATGIMTRYGTAQAPVMHAIASCVDYLTGYLAAFGSACAIFRRDHPLEPAVLPVQVSLAQGAQLAQAGLLVHTDGELPEVPSGQQAQGSGPHDGFHATRDGFVYVVLDAAQVARLLAAGGQAEGSSPTKVLSEYLRRLRVDEAIARIHAVGASAHAVTSVARAPGARLTAPADPRTLPSLAVLTQDHPVGSAVTTVYPTYARATPALIEPPAPTPAPGANQADLRALVGERVPVPILTAPVDYLPS